MKDAKSKIMMPGRIGTLELNNRIIHSATFEGGADANGFPTETYASLYRSLADSAPGAIITGFMYTEQQGRAVHPGQIGLDSEDKIPKLKKITDQVHSFGSKIICQIAHAGRQTNTKITGLPVLGASRRGSAYFQSSPAALSENQILETARRFGRSAVYGREAGFDGVQLHAAHGYLLHQFLLPSVNTRKDSFGLDVDRKIGTQFLTEVVDAVRKECGTEYPILIKISHGIDGKNGFPLEGLRALIELINRLSLAGIEISYGTMEEALNIFRGTSLPLKEIAQYNFRYKLKNQTWFHLWKKFTVPVLASKIIPFTPAYNLEASKKIRQWTSLPLICVGGFRTNTEIDQALNEEGMDFVSLSRPFLSDPKWLEQYRNTGQFKSRCINCNRCAVMCDSGQPTSCRVFLNNGNDEVPNKEKL